MRREIGTIDNKWNHMVVFRQREAEGVKEEMEWERVTRFFLYAARDISYSAFLLKAFSA